MSTMPRLPAVDSAEPATFAGVTAHAPKMMRDFFGVYAEFWQNGVVAAEVKEMTRLRNARMTDCGY
ncbi:MAG: hypothetical protein L7T19_09800 [Pseudomonadales bacterium]|nr:hypothetical protein [Pseudomonadales bacterium]